MGVGLTYAFGEAAKGTALPVSSPTSTKILGLGVSVIAHPDSGVEIIEVQPSSPAEAVYLRVGDVILSVDGKTTNSPAELAAAISSKPAGSEVTVGYMAKTSIASFRKDVKVTLK